MVPGHTKFMPDGARRKSGVVQSKDTFNQTVLLMWIKTCAKGIGRDRTIILSYKKATQKLFRDIPGMSKNRNFILVGDDGLLNFDLDAEGNGPEFELRAVVVRLKKRSLLKAFSLKSRTSSCI